MKVVFNMDADDGGLSFVVVGVIARDTRPGLNVGVDKLPCISFYKI